MTVRTRIAPSPTGDPHLGTAYIALFNLVFAKQHGGEFILRIEDTDQMRSTRESETRIFNSLRWLGLHWSEGPDVGGEFGPYRQSERSDIYKHHVQYLLDQEHAFRCFCTQERLAALREQQKEAGETSGYDGHCLHLSQEDIEQRIAAGESHVIRMKVPSDGVCQFQDLLRGSIEIQWSQIDMQVLVKADGLPTYHLANVVDDHLMGITHVFRGEEWVNSAPKHQLLYQYFGWVMPQLGHLPLLRNPDKSKLSKRKNPTCIQYYQRMGFLPEAVLNYLGRMGWSMPDEREKFTLDEMIDAFTLERMSLGGPVFDVVKLRWLNGLWLRESLSVEGLAQRIQTWALNPEYLMPMLQDAQKRIDVLSDLAPLLGFYFAGDLPLTEHDFKHNKMDPDTVKTSLQLALWALEVQQDWRKETILDIFKALTAHLDLKLKDVMVPFFVAITGQASSVPVMDAMVHLGPDMSRYRIRRAIQILGGVSKKAMKKLEKQKLCL